MQSARFRWGLRLRPAGLLHQRRRQHSLPFYLYGGILYKTDSSHSVSSAKLALAHAIPAFNVAEPKQPLILARRPNFFKLFMNDVGLLAALYMDGIQLKILNGETNINFGSIYENFVAQELKAHGFEPNYYNTSKFGELDFVVEHKMKVLPIEVKSGKH